MEYKTNGNLLTTHGKYTHDIFRIVHTLRIGKLNFLLKILYNRTPTNRLDIQRTTDFYNNKYDVPAMTYFV